LRLRRCFCFRRAKRSDMTTSLSGCQRSRSGSFVTGCQHGATGYSPLAGAGAGLAPTIAPSLAKAAPGGSPSAGMSKSLRVARRAPQLIERALADALVLCEETVEQEIRVAAIGLGLIGGDGAEFGQERVDPATLFFAQALAVEIHQRQRRRLAEPVQVARRG